MKSLIKQQITRLSLIVTIILSGVAMIPFLDLPVGAIGWESLAGVYAPDLSVNENSGAPGSRFAFTGSNYPPNSRATVYVNGEVLGQVMTDATGGATLVLDTAGAATGQYNVTLEVNSNASATESIELVSEGEMVMPPSGFVGPIFYIIDHPVFLPLIYR